MTIDVQAMLEFLCILVYCVVLSAIYIAAPTGFPLAASTDCRLAQPVTPFVVSLDQTFVTMLTRGVGEM
jgi:hypothetical protein